jgi:hypothetical protein
VTGVRVGGRHAARDWGLLPGSGRAAAISCDVLTVGVAARSCKESACGSVRLRHAVHSPASPPPAASLPLALGLGVLRAPDTLLFILPQLTTGKPPPREKRASVVASRGPLSRAPAARPPFERRPSRLRASLESCRPQGGAAACWRRRARAALTGSPQLWHGARATSSVDGWASMALRSDVVEAAGVTARAS